MFTVLFYCNYVAEESYSIKIDHFESVYDLYLLWFLKYLENDLFDKYITKYIHRKVEKSHELTCCLNFTCAIRFS